MKIGLILFIVFGLPAVAKPSSSTVYYKWCKDWLPILSKKHDKIQEKNPSEMDLADINALCSVMASIPPEKGKPYTLTDGNTIQTMLDVFSYVNPFVKEALDVVCSVKKTPKSSFFFLMRNDSAPKD